MLLFVLLCMVIIVACHCSEILSEDQDLQRINDSFLTSDDVPEGWFLDYYSRKLREGVTVHYIQFRPDEVKDQPELDFIFVAQEIAVYARETEAKAAYQEKWKRTMPCIVMGQKPSEINFQSGADEFEIGCLYSTLVTQPENFCEAVARYDRLILHLILKTWDEDDKEQWFTWADFERVLEAMDRRALEAAGR